MACCLCAKSMSRLNWRGWPTIKVCSGGKVENTNLNVLKYQDVWGWRKHHLQRIRTFVCESSAKSPTFTRRNMTHTVPMACYTPTSKDRIGNWTNNKKCNTTQHWWTVISLVFGCDWGCKQFVTQTHCISAFFSGWAHNLPSDAKPTARPQWNGLVFCPWKHTKQKS